jgi:lipopolysaccharide export LptBFGC system permease protein LptF
MIFTLHRYIFKELIKIFILAAIGLTLILSLGSILQPIQKYGVGPQQVIHLLVCFLPVTLTFVLPMSGLFAATLAYGRLAGDNELDACKASGISPLTIVYPGCMLAILVAIANLLLSFHMMPYFVHQAESAIKADAKQILFRNIERRGYYKIPPEEEYGIYADITYPDKDGLRGVIIVKTKHGIVEEINSAKDAKISFNTQGRSNEVNISANQTSQISVNHFVEIRNPTLQVKFRALLEDEIDFKRINEMKEIQADPLKFYPIESLAQETYAQLATELLAQDINDVLQKKQSYMLRGEPNSIEISADHTLLAEEQGIEFQGNVEIKEFNCRTGRLVSHLICEKASLSLELTDLTPDIILDVFNASLPADTTPNIIMQHTVKGLQFPGNLGKLIPSRNLLSVTEPESISSILKKEPAPELANRAQALQREIRQTDVEIDAAIHSRLVFGIGCLPMIMIGIGLGILLRGGHMLSAFGVSCLPAIILIVGIVSGKHVAENPGSPVSTGLSIMWAGLGVLCLITAYVYRRINRN